MKKFLALVNPPLSVLLCGKPIEASLNVILTVCFWVPGVVHAHSVIKSHEAEKRNKELIKELQKVINTQKKK